MSTTVCDLLVTLTTGNATKSLYEGRTGVGNVNDNRGAIERTLGDSSISVPQVDTFCMIVCGAPFWLTITDKDGGVICTYVRGLYVAYAEAAGMLIEWDPVLKKESKIEIYWS